MNKLTLKQIIEMMVKIKENDINNEYDVYFDCGRPIIQLKLVEII